MDNATKQLFAGANDAFANAEANQGGGGGVWPDDGQHQVFLDRLEIQPNTTFRMGNKESIPATTVKFVYTLCEDPDRPEPLTFPGDPFDIPVKPEDITQENHAKRYEISMDRLKGHFVGILCTEQLGTLAENLEAVQNLLGQETAVVLTIDVQSRQGKGNNAGRTFRSEFVKECIGGPHLQAPAAETAAT